MAEASLPRILAAIPKGAWLPLGLLAAWAIAAGSGVATSPLFVSPLEVLRVPFADPDGREVWASLGASILRIAGGGVTGALLGLILGTLCGLSRVASLGIAPTINTARQIAVFAWIPLFTAWFGNGETTKLVFTALSTFFPIFLATERGIRSTPKALEEVAQALGLPLGKRLLRLYFPAALPTIQVGIRIAVLSAWIGTIGAEYAIGNGRGSGSFIASARDQFRMDIVLVGVFFLAVGGVALNHGCERLFAVLFPWAKE
ncbi:ABC transporter permease [Mesorhizobium terrae]